MFGFLQIGHFSGISILILLSEFKLNFLMSFSMMLFVEFPSIKNDINHKLMNATIENSKVDIIDFSDGNKTINNIVIGNNNTE